MRSQAGFDDPGQLVNVKQDMRERKLQEDKNTPKKTKSGGGRGIKPKSPPIFKAIDKEMNRLK
jgi:hypothetical protein